MDNLLLAWREFLKGKRSKKDVQEFQYNLFDNIQALHTDLKNTTYIHGGYHAFNISDPKPRNIHKAQVRDRLLHHAIYRVLYPFFDPKFIADSYSCRKWKGTHRALERFRRFAYKASENHSKTLWVLKCDIRKFFASIDQNLLIDSVRKYIADDEMIWLLKRVIGSFSSTGPGKGLPLGNLTSQLLVNVYMNSFDKFMKHDIKAKYYIRYADDFVILSQNREWLATLIPQIGNFLGETLKLRLHPNKVFIRTISSGVDFLGWVHFPDHRILRTTARKKMFRMLSLGESKPARIQSYLGLLSHGNAKKLSKQVESIVY